MYKLSPKAKQDIRDIRKYTKNKFGPTQASKYYNQLFDAFEKLSSNRSLGKNYDELALSIKGCRMQSHVIFFIIKPSHIDIVRILHKSKDYKRHV
ncbi:type II toxin-antitoxin system RelE/ParE family toxin [Agarilytica rhodophyticola]|uniref:type II toxin-antitoxin system RelE/ParE family toxin n=1 Tax=Agarilytica rhodophyticola TaxID=1737490 RepID=UPI000B348CF7